MKKYFAELLGTCVLVLFGTGVAVFSGGELVPTALAFGLAIIACAYVIGNVSGCHVNPAVSFAMYLSKKLDGKEVQEVVIATPRSYKNENGEYDTDFIPFILTGGIASNTLEYCKIGDIVGIKGSIHSLESKEGKHPFYLAAEKVSFLSSKAPSTDEDEEEE